MGRGPSIPRLGPATQTSSPTTGPLRTFGRHVKLDRGTNVFLAWPSFPKPPPTGLPSLTLTILHPVIQPLDPVTVPEAPHASCLSATPSLCGHSSLYLACFCLLGHLVHPILILRDPVRVTSSGKHSRNYLLFLQCFQGLALLIPLPLLPDALLLATSAPCLLALPS